MADHAPVPAAALTSGWRPAFRGGVRLAYDQAREQDALLYPEGVLLLNGTAGAVLRHCDGARTVEGIAAELAKEYSDVSMPDVLALLNGLAARRLITTGAPVAGGAGPGRAAGRARGTAGQAGPGSARPGRGADLPVPAALPVLLEPGGPGGLPRRADDRAVVPGPGRGPGAGSASGASVRRGAAGAPGSGGPGSRTPAGAVCTRAW